MPTRPAFALPATVTDRILELAEEAGVSREELETITMLDFARRLAEAKSPDVVKVCSCRREYSRSAFDALPFVGPLDDGFELLILRNCPCGSTIALAVGDSPSRDTARPEEYDSEPPSDVRRSA